MSYPFLFRIVLRQRSLTNESLYTRKYLLQPSRQKLYRNRDPWILQYLVQLWYRGCTTMVVL